MGRVVSNLDAPVLAGVHHLKLPVTDLARSREWYRTGLGCQVQIEFVEQGQLMGYGLSHPNGGPMLGLRLNPSVPGPPQDLTTSPSACPIRRRSTSSLPG